MAKIIIEIGGSGGGYVETNHNDLNGLNVGDYQHLTQSQLDRLELLIYENNVTVISNTPTIGERGLPTNVSLSYNIQSKDDIITSASINQGVGNVLANINQGTQIVPFTGLINNTTFTLSLQYTRNGNSESETKNSTYTTYIPQWSGLSIENNLNQETYTVVNSTLLKTIQSSDTISRDLAPNNEYIWFVSTNPNATITNNGFNTIIGAWNSTTAFFIKETVNFTLANNTTSTSLTFYRSRLPLTHSSQNYTIT